MKPRLAFISFASCEGCQLMFLNLEDEILKLLDAVEVADFREAMTERSDKYDVAFVEGSITRPSDEQKLKEIRERASVLIAFGACACTGGVNRMKNLHDLSAVRSYVYGDKKDWFETSACKALDEVVKVDHYIRGCPVSKREILEVVKSLLFGRPPAIPEYPVCIECKLAENVCVFQKGMVCLGPITRAGCDPMCPSYGNRCIGCRGLIDNPNKNAALSVLEEHGLTVEDILREFTIFQAYAEEKK